MGWRGTLRAMEAASRRAERESQRRYRQLQRDAKEQAKREALQQAAYEVEVFENQLERLTSVHKETPEVWDWGGVFNTPPPMPPERSSAREASATAALDAFRPGFLDKLLGRAEPKRQALAQAVQTAFAQDEQEYQKAYQEYVQRHNDWNERRQLAGSILQGDTQAYADALLDFNPFADISELGAAIEFKPHSAQAVEIRLTAEPDKLIPSEIKSLTSTGKLSTKAMPKGQFYEIYRDFICGVALRAGRELFAFLPAQVVMVNIQAKLLNTRTGNECLETILSVVMSRALFSELNFVRLDPSDAMENFPHRMEFRKMSGFGPVEALTYAESSSPVQAQPMAERDSQLPPSPAPTQENTEFERLLSTHAPENGFHRVPVAAMANFAGITQGANLTLSLSRRLAESLEDGGYCVEPDARFGGGSYDWNQNIGIFKREAQTTTPSPAYQGAANLLRLCVLVAAADGSVDPNELAVFRRIIETQLHFSETELKRLGVLERLLVENTVAASKTLTRVAKAIPVDKRTLVGQVLVKVAAVDHVMTKSEYRALERIFKVLEFLSNVRGLHLQSLLSRLSTAAGCLPRRIGLSATLANPQAACGFLTPDAVASVQVIEDTSAKREIKFGIKSFLAKPPAAKDSPRRLTPQEALDVANAAQTRTSERENLTEALLRKIPTPTTPSECEPEDELDEIADDIVKSFALSTNLIFGNSKQSIEMLADRLHGRVRRLNWPADPFVVHHGSLSKDLREDAEATLKSGVPATALCSSTLEMGIDIGHVRAIGQLDTPWTVSSMVQRLGRSGRRAGEAAVMRLYVREESPHPQSKLTDLLYPDLLRAIAMTRLMLERWLEPFDEDRLHLSTLVHQVLSCLKQSGGMRAVALHQTLCKRGPFRSVDQRRFTVLLRGLADHDLIEQVPEGDIILALAGESITSSFDFYAAFQSTEEFVIRSETEEIGKLPASMVPPPNEHLILAGKRWRVLKILPEQKLVLVALSPGGKAPSFQGAAGEIHSRVMQEIRAVLAGQDEPSYIDGGSKLLLRAARRTAQVTGLLEKNFLVGKQEIQWFPWTGTRALNTLSLLAKSLDIVHETDRLSITYKLPSVDAFLDHLRNVSSSDVDAVELAGLIPVKQMEKFDDYIPESLLDEANARSRLSLREAREAAMVCLSAFS